MSHFGAPCSFRGLFYALVPVPAYADQFLQFPHRTPGVRRSLINVPVSFQLREIKEANQRAILNALNHPDANITKLLEETEAKYSGI